MIKILISRKTRTDLLKKFKVNTSTVYKALTFKSHSIIARRIRCYAVNKLGAKLFII